MKLTMGLLVIGHFSNWILQAASDLYAEAIELDPEEPSYYTNRAAASSESQYSIWLQKSWLSDC